MAAQQHGVRQGLLPAGRGRADLRGRAELREARAELRGRAELRAARATARMIGANTPEVLMPRGKALPEQAAAGRGSWVALKMTLILLHHGCPALKLAAAAAAAARAAVAAGWQGTSVKIAA